MDLGSAVVYAALKGVTTALPLSDSGHQLAALIWLGRDGELATQMAVAQIGCLLAFFVVVRERLATAFSEGIRGIAQPAKLQSSVGGRDATAVVVASLCAGLSDALTRQLASPLNDVPVVVGCGLLLSAVALASTLMAPAPHGVCPGLAGSVLVGVAYGVAVFPGASRIGAAFVMLCWLGITRWRAAELAMMISVPVMCWQAVRSFALRAGQGGVQLGTISVGRFVFLLLVSFVAARLAASAWRSLCERRRSALLALWLVPMALAMLAYSQALPKPHAQSPGRAEAEMQHGGRG